MAIIPTKSHSGRCQTCMMEPHYTPCPTPDPDPSSLILVPWNKLAIQYPAMPQPLPAPNSTESCPVGVS
eukprot:3003397-Ditylum_brightwellii.AAC.1